MDTPTFRGLLYVIWPRHDKKEVCHLFWAIEGKLNKSLKNGGWNKSDVDYTDRTEVLKVLKVWAAL